MKWKTPDEKPEDIEINEKSKKAGGIPAVLSSMSHTFKKVGVLSSISSLRKINQVGGFDCPGCAWPEPKNRSVAEFCENGAKAIAEEATKARITPSFFQKYSINDLAKKSDYWLGLQGRLTHPMILKEGSSNYEMISWDQAFKEIASELKDLDDPNEAIFYTSGRTSNEAAFLYQLMIRKFGTNNLPDCSNMCHESSGIAMGESIGIGKGTVTLEDFDLADCILIYGQNPGTNHPRMLTSLQSAARRGAKIITINPLKEVGTDRFIHPKDVHLLLGSGTKLTTQLLQIRINGDVALTKGLMKGLLEAEERDSGNVLDHEFIKQFTEGSHEVIEDIKKQSWDSISEYSGVSKDEILKASEIIAKSKRIIGCWAMGLTQHRNAVGNIQEVLNLLLLKGSMGKPGAGACPVRGHSNVQGDRTMGIWEAPPESFLKKLDTNFKMKSPRPHGYNVVQAIEAMTEGKGKVFFAMGGNFLSASPDTEYTAKALTKTRLTVQVSTKLNRSHLVTGKRAIILPCLGRTERDLGQFVTVENSMGIVHQSKGHLSPASNFLKSEPEIVCLLAKELLPQDSVKWDDLKMNYDEIREMIAITVPGFENYNEKVRGPGGFSLPNPPRDERRFETANGKANLFVHPMPENKIPEDKFMMMTIRTHDQFNTTVYGLEDRYRGIKLGRRVILMNEEDMKDKGLVQGLQVDLHSHFNGVKRSVERFFVVTYDIPRKCVATYFPEANPLIPIDSYALRSMTPTSKSVLISLTNS
jgi:molybdopterin-dependent oxidoreductase alpha subunit